MRSSTSGLATIGLSVLGISFALSLPAANATEVTAEVRAIDGCSWAIAGSPEEINLTAGDGVKYEGAELGMSYSFSGLSLGLAGSQDSQSANEGDSSECGFYSDIKNSQIEVTLTTTNQFTASYGSGTRDALMDFGLTGDNPLTFTATRVQSCLGDPQFTLASSTDMTEVSIVPWKLIETNTLNNDYDPAVNQRCGINLRMDVKIPAFDGVPSGAGSSYSFTGPAITIALVPKD